MCFWRRAPTFFNSLNAGINFLFRSRAGDLSSDAFGTALFVTIRNVVVSIDLWSESIASIHVANVFQRPFDRSLNGCVSLR